MLASVHRNGGGLSPRSPCGPLIRLPRPASAAALRAAHTALQKKFDLQQTVFAALQAQCSAGEKSRPRRKPGLLRRLPHNTELAAMKTQLPSAQAVTKAAEEQSG